MRTIGSVVRRNFTIFFLGVLTTAAVLVTGCKKDDSSPLQTQATVSTSADVSDAADAVSDALASNNGGAMDQVNDVFEIAGGVGVGVLGKVSSDTTYFLKTYDSATVSWTTTTYKEQSAPPSYYGAWTRVHWLQFRANGNAQKFRLTAGVAADSIIHQLTGGTGYFYTPRLIHHLRSIASIWVASNTNTDTVTINGSYAWAGVDTIQAPVARKGRVLNDSLFLTFVNVKGPKGPRVARSAKTSGTINVFYSATVTGTGKPPYTVTEQFTIVLGGGDATFSIAGAKFVSDLATGDH